MAKGLVLHFHVWLRAVTDVSGCCAFKDKELKGMIVVATDEGIGGVLYSLPIYSVEFIVPCLRNFCNEGG
eukprot:37108-Pelagomonas_calceolata.AAC.1